MGRRARARARAAAAAESTPASQSAASQGTAGPTGWETRQRLLAALNPIKRRSRGRARFAAVAFGLLALMLVGAALANDRPSLLRPAVLLGLLAVLWGLRALFMSEEPDS
jgi:hypothetical protein